MAQLEGPMQLIELEAFTALGKLDANQIPEARRRFMTLLAPSSAAMRKGGSGRILQVFNSFGQPFALKSLLVKNKLSYMCLTLSTDKIRSKISCICSLYFSLCFYVFCLQISICGNDSIIFSTVFSR